MVRIADLALVLVGGIHLQRSCHISRNRGQGVFPLAFSGVSRRYGCESAKRCRQARGTRKIQMQDFMIEKSAFDALATHPAAKNIAHALRAGTVDGRFTIVMPYFRGGSVRDLCKNLDKAVEDGIISVGQRRDSALYIMRGILNGMKYLSSTLIHRDLKPDNVLLHIERNVMERAC